MEKQQKKHEIIQTALQQLEAISQDETSPLEMRAALSASALITMFNTAIDVLPKDIQSRVTHALELYIKMVRNLHHS